MHRAQALLALLVLTCATPLATAQISLAGFVFDDLAGPDAAVLQPGHLPRFAGTSSGCATVNTLPGQSLDESAAAVFLDDGFDSWSFGKTLVRLDFVDNVVLNGPGADLVVFELGVVEDFALSIFVESLCEWSAPLSYTPLNTGFSQNPCGTGSSVINARAIDLDDFGVPSGAAVRRVLLDNKGVTGSSTVGSELTQLMALHSAAPGAPQPSCLLEFQQGLDSGVGVYLGTRDTCLAADALNTNFSAAELEYSDANPERNLLLRFDGLVGSAAGQIPPGAGVQRALLTLTAGAGNAGSNGAHHVHRVLQAWDDSAVTFANSFGSDGVDADGFEAELLPTASILGLAANASVTLDVTSAVQAWAGGAPNHGLAVLATTSDGLGLQLAEAPLSPLRPTLQVQLDPNPWMDVGFGLAGTFGAPSLSATGALLPDAQVQVQLLNARMNSLAHVFAGISQIFLPFKGGVLVPAPDLMILGLPTGPAGKLMLAPTWPAGVPAGIPFTLQIWVTDPLAPRGYAASNAISSLTQ